MGAPSFSILSEIFLQELESTSITEIITNNNILGYFRYVDDVLIVYNEKHTNIHDVKAALNQITPTINFTLA
jgi:hypothetical protein